MILQSVEITHVGPFREAVRLGPFVPGFNVLAAPNESGKSAALHAAARALFDKHTSKAEELKALQPAGTELAPRIAVEFETQGGRFRIEKTFLQAPRSLLSRWEGNAWRPIAEADAADQRMQDLLHSSLPGRGATRAEHWGFLGFLWARQGELTEWPSLADEAIGQRIRARLARVQLDPVIEKLSTRLSNVADSLITSTGQPRVGGPLRQAEDDLAGIESELVSVRQAMVDLEGAYRRHQHVSAEVEKLTEEQTEREKLTKELSEQALATERLSAELNAHLNQLASAQAELSRVVADSTLLNQRQSELIDTQAASTQADETVEKNHQQALELRKKIDAQEAVRPELEIELNTLRTEHQRLQSLLKLRQSAAQYEALTGQLGRARSATEHVALLQAKRAKLPDLTPAKVRKLEDLSDQLRNFRAQIQALGLTIDLTPECDGTIAIEEAGGVIEEPLAANVAKRLQRPSSLDLRLIGWGRISVRSGAKEAQDLSRELAAAGESLREALERAEVVSLEAAREALASRRDLENELKSAAGILANQLGDQADLEALRAAIDSLLRRIEAQTTQLQPTPEEQARSIGQIDTEEARLAERIPAAEKTLRKFDQKLTLLRDEERNAVETRQKSADLAGKHRERLRTLEAQITDLRNRYPDGIDAAKVGAQIGFVHAEARVEATRKNLPADFAKLPDRNRRAVIALQALRNELQARRSDRDQAHGQLETLGGKGLYSRETELEEKKAEAMLRRDSARSRAWATRLAHDLIEYRKQAATKAVLTPLEDRLTAAFAELTGKTDRKVFLDEQLQIAGLGQSRESAYGFAQLSQGAKEQLLLCLRIAVAQELAVEEPQTLILDDVLVNTDLVRQDRILDVLAGLSDRIQVIILTCHPDRYRGVGEAISFVHRS